MPAADAAAKAASPATDYIERTDSTKSCDDIPQEELSARAMLDLMNQLARGDSPAARCAENQ